MGYKAQLHIEIGEPERSRKPIPQEIQFYTGKKVEVMFVLPAGGGFKEYPVLIEDTPDGWHQHRTAQAKAFGQEPPEHPLNPSFGGKVQEVWRVPVVVDGESSVVEVLAEDYDSGTTVYNAVTEELCWLLEEQNPQKQIVVNRGMAEVR